MHNPVVSVNRVIQIACPINSANRDAPDVCTKQCMYNADGCVHPAISGLSDEDVFSKMSSNEGLSGKALQDHLAKQVDRIHNAVILDKYAEWVLERKLQIAPTDDLYTLMCQCLNKSLLHQLLGVLKLDKKYVLAMCVSKHWRQFAQKYNISKSFDQVSEVNMASLLLLRSKIPM